MISSSAPYIERIIRSSDTRGPYVCVDAATSAKSAALRDADDVPRVHVGATDSAKSAPRRAWIDPGAVVETRADKTEDAVSKTDRTVTKIHEGTYGVIYSDATRVYKIGKAKDVDGSVLRELYFLSRFDSPHILRQYGPIDESQEAKILEASDSARAHLYAGHLQGIVLEKMDCNLKEFCHRVFREHAVRPDVLARVYKTVFEQLLRGMNDIYKRRVLHNDLKLINVLVKTGKDPADVVIKICDFGLAVQTSRTGFDDITCIGTCKYSAPEMRNKSVIKFYQTESKYEQSLDMDIYSGGVVMLHVLEILTGAKESDRVLQTSVLRLLDRMHCVSYRGHVVLPKAGVDVLYSMLHENPGRRWTPRTCLKSEYFGGTIPRFSYSAHLTETMPRLPKGLVAKHLDKFNAKMHKYLLNDLPVEILFNIFYVSLQLIVLTDEGDATHTRGDSSYASVLKTAAAWVLSVYHHRKFHLFKKIMASSNERARTRRDEHSMRVLIPRVHVVPAMYLFRDIHDVSMSEMLAIVNL